MGTLFIGSEDVTCLKLIFNGEVNGLMVVVCVIEKHIIWQNHLSEKLSRQLRQRDKRQLLTWILC